MRQDLIQKMCTMKLQFTFCKELFDPKIDNKSRVIPRCRQNNLPEFPKGLTKIWNNSNVVLLACYIDCTFFINIVFP